MTDPDHIVPKLLGLKHSDQVRRLNGLITQLRALEARREEVTTERAALDQKDSAFAQLSLQHGYARYLQARYDALSAQIQTVNNQANALQRAIKETICSQSIIADMSQT